MLLSFIFRAFLCQFLLASFFCVTLKYLVNERDSVNLNRTRILLIIFDGSVNFVKKFLQYLEVFFLGII